MTTNTLINDQLIEWEDLGGGIRRKVMAHDETLMMVKVAFEAGGIGALHAHPHTQSSYIASGKFELTIGDEQKILQAGDAYFVPSGVLHGAVCLEQGVLIDVFTPRREDFV